MASTVIEGIKASYANVLTADYGGIRDWKALVLNGGEEKPIDQLKPYEMLFLAILMDAIDTLKRDPNKLKDVYAMRKRVWHQAERWLLSDDDGYVLGFVNICEHFGWDHRYVRKKIIEHINQTRRAAKPQEKVRRVQVRRNGEIARRKKRKRKIAI